MSEKILIDRAVVKELLSLHDAKVDVASPWDAAFEALREALAQQPAQEPLFWFRPRSDGMYEGPIHNAQIERVRKESGGWVPLYTAPPAPRPLTADRINELWRMSKTNIGWNDFETVVKEVESAHGIGATK